MAFTPIPAVTPQWDVPLNAADTYYAAFLGNGTTNPSFMAGSNGFASGLNAGLALSASRALSFGSVQTAMPATIVPAIKVEYTA